MTAVIAMSGTDLGLAIAVFLACTVEAVEALTIVLAVGITRSWRSTFVGIGAAVILLGGVTAALGPALTALPLDVLRVAVGGLLLVFGLQWLRKAILRASGHKALHDERQIYESELSAARAAGRPARADRPLLVHDLVQGRLPRRPRGDLHRPDLRRQSAPRWPRAAAAGVAVALVVIAGIAIHAPLARVPENTMKFAVGVMLTSFGTFWGAEGAGAHWPGGDAALLAVVPGILLFALAAVVVMRGRRAPAPGEVVAEA